MDCPANGKPLPAITMSDAPAFPRTAAVIVAAGKGMRAGQDIPKQFTIWRGKAAVRHSAEAFRDAGITPIVVVIPDGAQAVAGACLEGIDGVEIVAGGDSRQASVFCGLKALEQSSPDRVLIHDAARPLLPQAVIERLGKALDQYQAAIPALPVVDSLLHENDGMMGETADRARMRRVQTPQAFHYAVILDAHRQWSAEPDAGDDAQVAQAAGIKIALVEGDETLRKLTYASDFSESSPPYRIGTGYDVHRLASGEALWLCGVKIDHDQGLCGHSDADVATHALVDAMLGAIGAGDIGQHFPPGDPQWSGAASERFLVHAAKLVAEHGYCLGNADLTIICEAPKIGPYRDAMRKQLAAILGVDMSVVSVKATTTERLGFTGRGEGIAAQAAVGLVKV